MQGSGEAGGAEAEAPGGAVEAGEDGEAGGVLAEDVRDLVSIESIADAVVEGEVGEVDIRAAEEVAILVGTADADVEDAVGASTVDDAQIEHVALLLGALDSQARLVDNDINGMLVGAEHQMPLAGLGDTDLAADEEETVGARGEASLGEVGGLDKVAANEERGEAKLASAVIVRTLDDRERGAGQLGEGELELTAAAVIVADSKEQRVATLLRLAEGEGGLRRTLAVVGHDTDEDAEVAEDRVVGSRLHPHISVAMTAPTEISMEESEGVATVAEKGVADSTFVANRHEDRAGGVELAMDSVLDSGGQERAVHETVHIVVEAEDRDERLDAIVGSMGAVDTIGHPDSVADIAIEASDGKLRVA